MSDGLAVIESMPNPSYAQIKRLESEMLAKLNPVDAPVTHHFAHGIYGRELFIPAGSLLTGKMHRYSTLNLLIKGEITVTTPDGLKRIHAPAIFTSPAGVKKIGYAHTDTIWVNVHPTKLTNLDDIEAKFIIPEKHQLIEWKEEDK